MRPAVILARVSSAEQEAGHSLEAQLANLQEYAQRRDLDVIETFRIIESSTKGHRPEFERLIEFIGKQKTRTALIVDCVDRLQRSFTHTPVLNALMVKDLLEIHFVREGNVIDKDATSMQKLMWNMGTVMAQSYTDQLTDNVKRSIKHKLANGEWIARAPLGYMNALDTTTGKNTVVIDPARADLVRKVFHEYAAGVSSMMEICRKTQEWSLLSRANKPLGLQTIARMLEDPFYSGQMRVKGELFRHAYPPIITRSVFEFCQRRKRRANSPEQDIKVTRHPFILRGLVTCAVSGKKATCSLAKGKYVYLRAFDPADPKQLMWVKEEHVLNQLTDVLRSFRLADDLMEKVLDYIRATHEAEKDFHHSRVKELHIEKTNIEGKIDRLTDLLVDGHIQEGIYKQKHKELSKRLNEITYEAEGNTVGNLKFKEALCNIVVLLSKSHDLFNSSHVEEKRKLLGFVFENLELEGATLRFSLRKPFELLAQLPDNPAWRPLRDSNFLSCD